MTKIKVGKNGKIGYMVGIMPNPTVKGGYGKKAIALYVVDPKSMNVSGDCRYVIQQARMQDIEFVDKFPWEESSSAKKENTECKKCTKKVVARKNSINTKISRLEASKDFAKRKNMKNTNSEKKGDK